MARSSTSFKPGQSGNRKGAPKKEWTWSSELKKAVEEKAKDGKPIKYHVSRSLVNQALKGNVNALREMMNRMDGMPKQSHEVEGNVTVNIDGTLAKHE